MPTHTTDHAEAPGRAAPDGAGWRRGEIRRDPRAGVALLIVLGLLALLMITAVAFTILMRIERASASNLRHTTAARQMAKGALAYAIAALDKDIGADPYPDWPDREYTPAGHNTQYPLRRPKLHIPEEIFFSVDEDKSFASQVTEARVLTAETARYLPAALRHRAEIIGYIDGGAYDSPAWIPVTKDGTTDGEIIGRYAYVILNTSGLLDANSVHTNTTAAPARWMGADPGELQLDPAVQRDVVDVSQFTSDRKDHGRYETLPELSTLNTGVDGEALANFDVFSYSVPNLMPVQAAIPDNQSLHKSLRDRTRGRRIDISTEAKIKAQRNNILEAFKACGINDSTFFYDAPAKWAYLGLLDYVDADNEPAWVPEWEQTQDEQQFARPATEAMPLFSLAAVNVFYSASGEVPTEAEPDPVVTHTMTYLCTAQFDYPFQAVNGPFTLEADMTFYPIEATGWEPLLPATVSLNGTASDCGPGNEFPLINNFEQPVALEVKKKFSEGPPRLSFMVECRGRTMNSLGTPIRKTPATDAYPVPFFIVTLTDADLQPGTYPDVPSFSLWSEALDPRFNWGGYPTYWRASRDDSWNPANDPSGVMAPLKEMHAFANGYVCPPEPPLLNMNSLTQHMLSDPPTMWGYFRIITDEMRVCDPWMQPLPPLHLQKRAHVADRPLRSVGELGYLPIGLWLTLTLYDHGHEVNSIDNEGFYPHNHLPSIGYHPVLDYFILGDPDKGRRGLVNLNTLKPEVLGAVFSRLPVQSETDMANPPEPRIGVPQVANPDFKNPNKPKPWIKYFDAFCLNEPNIKSDKRECNDATELAQWLIAKGPFGRLSDLGRFYQGVPQLGLDSAAYTDPFPLSALEQAVTEALKKATPPLSGHGSVAEFEREALIRNACNLVTLRGQTFTIILRADAFSPRFGMKGVKQGNVLATAMAVAQVWRDTEPMIAADGTKRYPAFVQFFKILNE